MNNDWKDLEIGNIPSDFFVNQRYEIKRKMMTNEGIQYVLQIDDKVTVLKYIINYSREYVYRLKPLEPMRMTIKAFEALFQANTGLCKIEIVQEDEFTEGERFYYFDDRQVEIME